VPQSSDRRCFSLLCAELHAYYFSVLELRKVLEIFSFSSHTCVTTSKHVRHCTSKKTLQSEWFCSKSLGLFMYTLSFNTQTIKNRKGLNCRRKGPQHPAFYSFSRNTLWKSYKIVCSVNSCTVLLRKSHRISYTVKCSTTCIRVIGVTNPCDLMSSEKRNGTSNPSFTNSTPHTSTNITQWQFVD
jgi:hypothetical protein